MEEIIKNRAEINETEKQQKINWAKNASGGQ